MIADIDDECWRFTAIADLFVVYGSGQQINIDKDHRRIAPDEQFGVL
jgi:hypothetical protein